MGITIPGIEVHDVGVDRIEVDIRVGAIGERFGQSSCSTVIVGQPIPMMFDSVLASSDLTGLTTDLRTLPRSSALLATSMRDRCILYN